ncbi:transposable element Tcb2 transposase [Trichonephila clavipes]|nr:transposable element Tcb2 transposase [Trichonephila clavipes]
MARRHRNMNATLLQQHLRSATGTTVSTQTVRNWLHGVGLYARRPIVRVRLTSRHRCDRRERIFILRDRGSKNNPAFVHESVRFGGGGVLVYDGISIDFSHTHTDLYIIRDEPLTARRYRDEILRPIVVPYAAAIGDDFILMDNNCGPHRANLVEDFLFVEGIEDELLACQPPPQTLQEMEGALLEEWERIPQLVINSLIDFMPQSCQVIYSQFALAIHQNDHQARRRFVEWAQNEIAFVPDFQKRILFSDEAHFWLNGYVNKQNCRIWSEANPQVYVETPLHPEKLTVWCASWAGGIIGPYFFKNNEGHNVTVNGDRYRAMITNFFIPELNNHDVQELWFQQDGATCHTARATIDLLKDTFGDRLISRFGPF